MSTHDGVADNPESPATDKPRYCIVVPKLHSIGSINFDRFNIVGWTDRELDSYVCEICKKQQHLALSELLIFPKVKADTDLFQFVYTVPPHRIGGAFSTQICGGSGTKVVKDRESPTSIRVIGGEGNPSESQDQTVQDETAVPSTGAKHEEVDREEVKKKVQGLSPEMAEERYNYLLSRPISELTDAEYAERLALIDRLTEKPKKE